MSVDALRTWGIAVSAAVMAVAIVIAAPWRSQAPGATAPVIQSLFQASQPATVSQPAPIGFVVRFRGAGPIARAQALAAGGRETEAARQIQAQLVRQSAFHGLCFDRFTVGGAEIVLRSCTDVGVSERAAFQTRWLAQLNAMRSVDYADANTTAARSRPPG